MVVVGLVLDPNESQAPLAGDLLWMTDRVNVFAKSRAETSPGE